MVAARELEDAVAPREAAREPDRAHRGLGAGGDEAHHLDRRHRVDDLLRELHLGFGRGAEGRPARGGVLDRSERLGVGVPEDERPPAHDPVDVALPLDVLDLGAAAAAHEDRLVEADRAHRADRRVDAARDQPLRPPSELGALPQSHVARSFVQYEKTRSAPGTLDRGQRLERGRALVQVAGRRGRLHHRVLAGDVVGGDRAVEALADGPEHVEIRQRRLHHQHVGALGEVELALAQRLADVRRIHLVAAAVAEGRRRLGDVAERPVEGGGVLGGVRDDRRLRQELADRADAAVHHVAGRDGVGAGLDVADGGPREQLERLVVRDLAVPDHAAMPVRRVLAEAHVGDEDELRVLGADRPQRPLDDPVLVPGARALVVLLLGHAEEDQRLAAERRELARLARPDPRPRSGSSRAAPRSDRRRADEVAASRSRRGRAASRARARAGRPYGAVGAGVWRERRSRHQGYVRRTLRSRVRPGAFVSYEP